MKGFTLIESIVYLALLSLLMLGCISLAYGAAMTTNADTESLAITEEGAFVIAKLRYAAAQADGVIMPNTGTDSELRLSAGDDSLEPIVVRLSNGAVEMKEGSSDFSSLTSHTIDSLAFIRDDDYVLARFVLEGREFSVALYVP